MDNSSLQVDRSPSEGGIAPLTKSKLDGTPYKRHQDVEVEIAEVMATDPSTWSPESLKSETLVHLIRLLWKRNDQKSIGKLIDCLGRRITRIARDIGAGLPKSALEEFAIEIAVEVNLSLFAREPTRRSEFLEIAFRKSVQGRAITMLIKVNERLANESVNSSLGSVDSNEDGLGVVESHPDQEGDSPDESILVAEAALRRPELIRKGLSAVSNARHQEAVILHYLRGWPITTSNDGVPNLCTHFNRSDRMIRKWLEKARKEMRAALENQYE